jgi:hypothetical protein
MKLNDVTRGTGLEEHGITNAKRMLAYMHGRDLFVQDCFVGADWTAP